MRVIDENLRCTRCNQPLNRQRVRWLELNCRTGRYSNPDEAVLPVHESQGCFPFGIACAKTQLKEDRR
jgi:phage FluMu protein Com